MNSFILIILHLVIHTYILEVPGTTAPRKKQAFSIGWKLKNKENSKKGNVAISNLCAGMTSEVDIPVIDQFIHFQRYKYIQKVRQPTRRLSSRLVLVPRQQTGI